MRYPLRTLPLFALAALAVGCGGITPTSKPADAPKAAGETGPHKGPVAEWGDEEFNLEVVADAKAGTVTVYVYGDDQDLEKGERNPLPRDTKITLTLKGDAKVTLTLDADPEKDDPAGTCSRFTARHDAFTKGKKLAGSLSATVRGKPFSGDFKEE